MMVGVLDNAHHVVVGQPVGTRNGFVSEDFVILAEGALQCAVAETAHPQCAAHIFFQTVYFVGGQLFVVYFIGHEIVLGDVLPTGIHGIETIVCGNVQPAIGRQLKVVYLGGIVTFAGYGLYNFGVKRLSAGRAAAYTNLIPVFALLFGVALLDEKLLRAQYGGALLIVLGVVLSQWKGKAPKPTEQQT